MQKRGFTLVELLVVIAIIGILIALLLPAVQAARESARRSQCANNIKQICLAALNYESTNNKLPPGSVAVDAILNTDYMTNWAIEILPFIEMQPLYDIRNPKQPLHHENNRQLRETLIGTYLCPSDLQENTHLLPHTGEPGSLGVRSSAVEWAIGSYRANAGGPFAVNPASRLSGSAGNYFWDHPNLDKSVNPASQGPMHVVVLNSGRPELQQVSLKKILDGLSNTLLMGEYHTITFERRRTFWAYAYAGYAQSSVVRDAAILIPSYEECNLRKADPNDAEICKRGWGSLHSGGIIQYGFCDGSVSAISENVDIVLLFSAASIRGGESGSVRE